MPHFSECCGVDEYICQKCARIFCSQCDPSSYIGGVVADGRVTNICPSCLEKETAWKMVARPPKDIKAVPYGSFVGLMYEIKLDDLNKMKPRNVCPCCSSRYSMKDMIACNGAKDWLFECPSCSTKIKVVR